jgi:circadian clock protein KaiC
LAANTTKKENGGLWMDAAQAQSASISKSKGQPGRSPRVPFGVLGLDEVLHGGLPAGHLYLLEGTPGAGKTTIALQFVLTACDKGQKALYITLSESRQELLAVAASHGWDLTKVPVFALAPQEDSLRAEHQYSVFNPEDVELNELTDLISKKVNEVQPNVVVVDSLSELRLLARDSFRYRRQMLALKNFFEERNCTVLLIDNETTESREPTVHSIVHGLMRLEVLEREYGSERRRMRVQKIRGSIFREGFHDYRITTGGIVVHPRLVAAEYRHQSHTDVLATGIEAMDSMLKGGIKRGTSTLLLGAAGVGKSSLSSRFVCTALERGESAAIYIFDESSQVYLDRSVGLGINLQPYIDNGKLHLQQIDPAEIPPGELINEICSRVSKGASVVVIDSLNGWLKAMPGEQYLQLQMHELLTYLSLQGVATFLILAQQGVMGPMQAEVDVSYLADAIILLRYFEARGDIRKAISIFKKRSGPHESTIRELQFHPGGIAIGEPLKSFQGVLTGVPTYVSAENSKLIAEDAEKH